MYNRLRQSEVLAGYTPPDASSLVAMALGHLWSRKRLVTIWTVLSLLLASPIIAHLTPWYRADIKVALDARQSQFDDVNALGSRADNSLDGNFVRTEVGIIGSEGIARLVIVDLDLQHRPEFFLTRSPLSELPSAVANLIDSFCASLSPVAVLLRKLAAMIDGRDGDQSMEATVSQYIRNLTVTNDSRSYLIKVSFESPDASLAKAIVTDHARVFINAQRTAKDHALWVANRWLKTEVDRLGTQLTSAENAVQTYRDQHPLVSTTTGSSLEQQLTNATEQLDLANDELKSSAARTPGELDPDLEIARQHQAEQQQRVVRLKEILARFQREQLNLQQLDRELSAQRSLYESVFARMKQIETQVGVQQADTYLVSASELPIKPIYPNQIWSFGLFFFISLGSTCLIVFCKKLRRGQFATLDGVYLSFGLRQLATIPRVAGGGQPCGLALPDLVADQRRSAVAEAIRGLRNSFAFRGRETTHVLAVASYLPGDGKTSVALGLARSLSSTGCRVLLIEGDLHHRSLAQLLGHRGPHGIIAVLSGKIALKDAVVADRVQGLSILPAEEHVSDPQNLLLPSCFSRLIRRARQTYDYVIVDTPPVGAVSDAVVIAASVQSTLLVIRARRTPNVCIARAMRDFSAANCPLLGAVLNFAEPEDLNSFVSYDRPHLTYASPRPSHHAELVP